MKKTKKSLYIILEKLREYKGCELNDDYMWHILRIDHSIFKNKRYPAIFTSFDECNECVKNLRDDFELWQFKLVKITDIESLQKYL